MNVKLVFRKLWCSLFLKFCTPNDQKKSDLSMKIIISCRPYNSNSHSCCSIYFQPPTYIYRVQRHEMRKFSSRSALVLKLTQSFTRSYTRHILLSCLGGASGNSIIGEWTLTPVSQLSGWVSLGQSEITASPSLLQPTEVLCADNDVRPSAQQGFLLGHQRAPAVRDDRHGLRDDSKLYLPCQQVSP